MIKLEVDGVPREFAGDEQMPLLWYLRDELKLKGAKFGCGIGQCGACTVHLNGAARRSCVTPMGAADEAKITTIEGLARGARLHPVQRAWMEQNVPQCGYCQTGQIMAAAELLQRIPRPTDEDIDSNLTNLCRCGTYLRIRKAIHRAASLNREEA